MWSLWLLSPEPKLSRPTRDAKHCHARPGGVVRAPSTFRLPRLGVKWMDTGTSTGLEVDLQYIS